MLRFLMSSAGGVMGRVVRAVRLFGRGERGSAAIDFALVVVPFLAVLMAIIESSITLFAGQVLQAATTNAARSVMTGQVQQAGTTAQQFQNTVCASLTVMFNCASNLHIDIESFPSFTQVNLNPVVNANGTLTGNYGYSPGNSGDVVIVRLIYQWPIIGTGLGFGLTNSANNTYTLIATAAFRNEPY